MIAHTVVRGTLAQSCREWGKAFAALLREGAQNAHYLYPKALMNYTNLLQLALESLVAGGLRRRAPPLHPKVAEPGGGENKFNHARGPNKNKSACILGVCVWCIRFRHLFFEDFCAFPILRLLPHE